MSIEIQLDDIQCHINRLETLLEALQPQPMTMSAAIALSVGNKARTEVYEVTIVVEATDKRFCGTTIRDGAVTFNTSFDRDGLENWLYTLFFAETSKKVWVPI